MQQSAWKAREVAGSCASEQHRSLHRTRVARNTAYAVAKLKDTKRGCNSRMTNDPCNAHSVPSPGSGELLVSNGTVSDLAWKGVAPKGGEWVRVAASCSIYLEVPCAQQCIYIS